MFSFFKRQKVEADNNVNESNKGNNIQKSEAETDKEAASQVGNQGDYSTISWDELSFSNTPSVTAERRNDTRTSSFSNNNSIARLDKTDRAENSTELEEEVTSIEYMKPNINLFTKAEERTENLSLSNGLDKLQNLFAILKIGAQVIDVKKGQNIDTYSISLNPGVRVNRVTKIKEDIALCLGAKDVEFEIPLPGTNYIGAHVKKDGQTKLAIRTLLEDASFTSVGEYAFPIGRDLHGETIVESLCSVENLLVSGTTGSGKSNFLLAMLLSLSYSSDPNCLKIVLVDTSAITYSLFYNSPFNLIPIINKSNKAVAALRFIEAEIESRFSLFASAGAKDIFDYNKRIDDASLSGKGKKLPHVLLIIDDLAKLMEEYSVETEEGLSNICMRSRTVGVHVFISTQRSSADVITGRIKENIPNRISFSVPSVIDSKVILNEVGAEKLTEQGELLFKKRGKMQMIHAFAPFVTDEELRSVSGFIETKNKAFYQTSVLNRIEAPDTKTYTLDENIEMDELLFQAGRFVIEKQKASIGMIQRIFKIGFNRAARIMDQLEEIGAVGPDMGTTPRAILMTIDQFERYIENM